MNGSKRLLKKVKLWWHHFLPGHFWSPRKWSLQKKVALGFGLVVAVSTGIGWVDYQSVRDLEAAEERRAHTYEVLEKLEAVISDLKDVETGQRGYMLYGQEVFLQPYYAGLKAIPQDIGALRHLTQDNLIQQQRLKILESLASKKIAIATMRVKARRKGLEASKRVGHFGSGQQTMDNIRWLVEWMKATERKLAVVRSQQSQTRAMVAALTTLGGLGFNLAILYGLYYVINREMILRQKVEKKLITAQEQLQHLLSYNPTVIYISKASGDYGITFISENVTTQLGYTAQEFVEDSRFWADHVYPEDVPRVFAEFSRLVDQKNLTCKYRFLHKDGTYRWIQNDLRLIQDRSGSSIELVGCWQDITERKLNEDKLQVFARKLDLSNRELQDFIYIASHDLQEPLRKIQAFGNRLRFKYVEALGDQGREYLVRIEESAERMSLMLSDLLIFSRITVNAQSFLIVDLDQVVQEVAFKLETRIEQVGGRVEWANLPTIEAAPLQMRQLLQNLIDNALKFHHPEVPPIVRIQGYIQESENSESPHCQITVSDNGIGFEEKYQERIFHAFKRLYSRSTYEGSGMGLTICRKIVEQHDGSLTVKSTAGEGSTFTITLPIKRDAALLTSRETKNREKP